jgi:serine phosphatase RsbU (regulator of sigma subunit)/DNA-binding response OmpR family regulator
MSSKQRDNSNQADILVVDDTQHNLKLLVTILTKSGYKVRPATNGRMALVAAQAQPPDLVLLDVMMPDMNGYEVCQALKADERTSQVPVIFISAMSEVIDKVKAFSVGGVDYITKPFHVEEVLARINTHLTLRKLQRSLQDQNTQLQRAKESAEKASAALAALNEVGIAANSSLDLEADLEQALHVMLRETNLDYGWILLPEDNGRLLRLAAVVGLSDKFWEQEALTPVDRCPCGEMLTEGEALRTFKQEECPRLSDLTDQDSPSTAGHLSLTILARQKTVGLLNLGGKDLLSTLTSDQYGWLEAAAQQVGNAIENATLYQNLLGKAERLTVLNRTSTIISLSWQLDQVLPPLLREMARLLEMSQGLIVLRSEVGQKYEIRTRFGRWQSFALLKQIDWPELPVLDIIERTQAPLLVTEARQEGRLKPIAALIEQEKIQTVLMLPLVVQNQLIGFIQLHSIDQKRIFEATEIELAKTLTNQAALAIEKARLYEATVTRYEEELEIARQIQQNLLPRTVPETPGLRLAGLCRPAYETGGDFYDYIVLPRQRLGIVVGDVTGKSLPAAMVMALARNTVRSELVNNPHPAEAITTANRWLCQDIHRNTFVAVAQALFDPLAYKLWLVNAGQTAAILVRSGQTTYLLPPDAAGLPLGIQPDMTYTQAEISLQPGDILLFYTDGIVEAQNTTGEMFGFDRLESTMRNLPDDRNPDRIIEMLLAETESFVGQAEQHDDITLVAVQVM